MIISTPRNSELVAKELEEKILVDPLFKLYLEEILQEARQLEEDVKQLLKSKKVKITVYHVVFLCF